MAEEMNAERESAPQVNDTAPKQKEPAQKESGGLRGAFGGKKNEAAATNAATTANAQAPQQEQTKQQTTAPTTTAPQEKEAKTKGDSEKTAPTNEAPQKTEAEGSEQTTTQEAKTPASVAPINTATPKKVTWKDLRTMLQEKSFLTLMYKVQLSPAFFSTVCPSSLAGKDVMLSLLTEMKSKDAAYGAAKTFADKQSQLQEMLSTTVGLIQTLQSMLAGSMNPLQKAALQAYLTTIQNYGQSLQRKIANNSETYAYFTDFSASNKVDVEKALVEDKDFSAKFQEFAKKEFSLENIEAFLAIKKGITPKKFIFNHLYKGIKDDTATTQKMLTDAKARNNDSTLMLNVPNQTLQQIWQLYKEGKTGDLKALLADGVTKELNKNIADTFSRFASQTFTADNV